MLIDMRFTLLASFAVSSFVVVAGSACTISDVIAEGEPEGEGEGEEGEGEGEEGEGEEGEGEEGEGEEGRAFDCDGASVIVADVGCGVDADCGTAAVLTDCCGTPRTTAVNVDDAARFNAAYADCSANQPICDCAPGPLSADNGSTDDGGAVNVACVEGRCISAFDDGDRAFDCAAGGSIAAEAGCVDDAGCAVAVVQLDCCGSLAETGIAGDAQRAVSFTNAQCAEALGECGCLAEPTVADDGTSAPNVATSANVQCVEGLCRTTFGP